MAAMVQAVHRAGLGWGGGSVNLLDAIRAGDYDWREHAACAGHHPKLWFPAKGDKRSRDAALRICSACLVIEHCRRYALRIDPPDGIFGGLTARQRGEILGRDSVDRRSRYLLELSEMHRKPCGTHAAYIRHRRNGEEPCVACLVAERYRSAE